MEEVWSRGENTCADARAKRQRQRKGVDERKNRRDRDG